MRRKKLYKQKSPNDCAICCMAMLLEVSYNAVLKAARKHYKKMGMRYNGMDDKDERAVADALGKPIKVWHTLTRESKDRAIRQLEDNKVRGVLCVPSINTEGEYHAVFWDGTKLIDPSNKKKYAADGLAAFTRALYVTVLA